MPPRGACKHAVRLVYTGRLKTKEQTIGSYMRLIENKTMTTSGDFRKLIRGSGTEAFRRDKAAEPR